MSALILRFTRIDPTHHRFEALRADGSRESRELETRSFLAHDFTHYALETEAQLADGFYGALASGAPYEYDAAGEEARTIERVVGPLQSSLKGDVDADAFVDGFRAMQSSAGDRAPDWLDAGLVTRVVARFRELEGQWRATPFGATMELSFDV